MTGSELVRGEREDRNGPFLAAEAVRLGLDPERITIVGDRPEDLEAAFRLGFAADLCLVSGGLGPTHDDRTIELVARAAGRGLAVDPALEREIEGISRMIADRLGRPYGDFTTGVRKQATLPEGALSLGLAGTAPGVVLDADDCVVVVLPGPPRELRRLWPRALETAPVRRVLERAPHAIGSVLRFFGTPESAVAEALEDAGGDGDGVEATICAREFEIHVDLVVEPGAKQRAAALADVLARAARAAISSARTSARSPRSFSTCCRRAGSRSRRQSRARGHGRRSAHGIPGSSDVFVGSVVAYANAVKESELGVPQEVLERYGAVSAETAAAMAAGVRARLGADVGVAVTGVAGPDGGTEEKPVGLVFVHAVGPDGEEARRTELPGDRDMIRGRATAASLHLVRRLLES